MKLDRFKEKLLDLSMGNKLLNFKDSRTSTLEVKSPHIDELYTLLMSGIKLDVFNIDKIIEAMYQRTSFERIDISYDELLPQIEPKVKPRQIVCYKYHNRVFNVLTELHKKAEEHLTEKSINILYMTFGFLEYTVEGEQEKYVAPLLLVPIKILNDKSTGFDIELYEEETILNPTLVYKLDTENNIQLREFGEEETISEYLQYMKGMVVKKDWYILDEVRMGLFSFTKLNMYMDLKENEDYILQNPLIQQILGNDSEFGKDIKKDISHELHNVIDADSSQMDAIMAIKRGESIVLQGPPGTGKSQTITNIISECLADGKKVLFVSEKLAALNVVYDKLKKAGLEEFCLALHSNKTNKKEFITELYETLNSAKINLNTQATKILQELGGIENLLDGYTKFVHTPLPVFEETPYQVFCNLGSLDKIDDYDLSIKIDPKYKINRLMELYNDYLAYSSIVGYDYKDFCFYSLNIKKFKNKNDLVNIVSVNKDALSHIMNAVGVIENRNNLKIKSLQEFNDVVKLYNALNKMDFVHQNFFNRDMIKDYYELAEILEFEAEQIKNNMELISKYYNDGVYDINFGKMYDMFTTYKHFRGFNRNYKEDKRVLKTVAIKNKSYSYKRNLKILKALVDYETLITSFETDSYSFKKIMGDEFLGIETNFTVLKKGLKSLMNASKIEDYESFVLLDNDNYQQLVDKLNPLVQERDVVLATQDYYEIDLNLCDLKQLLTKTITVLADSDYYEPYNKFYDLLFEMDTCKLLDIVDTCIINNDSSERTEQVIRKVYYKSLIKHLFQTVPQLKSFSKLEQDKLVKEFIEKDKIQFEISKAMIRSKLTLMKPSLDIITPRSPAAIISKEFQKKRRQMPVRILLNSLGDFIQLLKPCFLMSPLSVSTYLEAGKVNFDICIFDEASQIFPQDAIGAIYRAKQLVVVGDSKQMPPSNFFNSMGVETNVESFDEDDVTNFESILDVCSSCFHQFRLKWHYRSRSEELIAFSNRNFYDDDLVTFPSSKMKDLDFGVDFIYVENGIFDRSSKTNIKEAEMVATLVAEHFEKYGDTRSLGVVAFSMSQQNCIESLLMKKGILNHIKQNEEAPFFIKNLETVQGDERDTIIFSVGYAKDETGKFIHNFGPLNQEGGERRLNVAITRARINVKLVSSIKYTEIDPTRTNAKGALLLRGYLEYAVDGYELNQKESGDSSGFMKEVKDFLVEQGYQVDSNVGFSTMKVDLCVKYPKTNNYALAILADGNVYNAYKNTRDRDRLRKEVLESMGFKVYQMWSCEWYQNTKFAKENLLSAIYNASSNSEDLTADTEELVSFSSIANDDTFKLYEYVDDQKLLGEFENLPHDFENMIREYAKVEGPIHEEYLLKRIVSIFGGVKITSKISASFDVAKIMYVNDKNILFVDDFIFLSDNEPHLRAPNGKVRDIKYVYYKEIAAGMIDIINNNKKTSIDGLYQTLLKVMGYSRNSDAITRAYDKALHYLISTQQIMINEDNELEIYVPEDEENSFPIEDVE